MGLVLFLVANLLGALLFPTALLFLIIKSRSFKEANRRLRLLAVAFDKYGNVVCAELFNATLITKKSFVHFGDIRQTISAVIGYNILTGTLSRTGKVLNWILNRFQKDHALKAIGYIYDPSSYSDRYQSAF